MRVCGTLGVMRIRIGRRLVGKAVVDGRGSDGVEQLIYGCPLVSVRVVDPIHRWWEGQGRPVCRGKLRGVRREDKTIRREARREASQTRYAGF